MRPQVNQAADRKQSKEFTFHPEQQENGKAEGKANRDRQHTGSIGMKARPQDTREKSTLQVIFSP